MTVGSKEEMHTVPRTSLIIHTVQKNTTAVLNAYGIIPALMIVGIAHGIRDV